MFFNPLGKDAEISTKYNGKVVYQIGGAEFADGKVEMKPKSFVMIEL